MLRIRVVQCLCTQCEGELLHLYEVCLPVISVCQLLSTVLSTILLLIINCVDIINSGIMLHLCFFLCLPCRCCAFDRLLCGCRYEFRFARNDRYGVGLRCFSVYDFCSMFQLTCMLYFVVMIKCISLLSFTVFCFDVVF